MSDFVTIKVSKSARADLKLIAALSGEKMQDVIERLVSAEKARQLEKQAAKK